MSHLYPRLLKGVVLDYKLEFNNLLPELRTKL